MSEAAQASSRSIGGGTAELHRSAATMLFISEVCCLSVLYLYRDIPSTIEISARRLIMMASTHLQAVMLRLREAVITAQNQKDQNQLNSLLEVLNTLLEVAYAASDRQLGIVLEALLDTVLDTLHGVSWKSDIPSITTILGAVPSDTASTAASLQQAILHNFLTSAVTMWARSTYAIDQAHVSFDDHLRATTYGVNTFAWAAEMRSPQLPQPIPVEIALDSDGYMSINRIAT